MEIRHDVMYISFPSCTKFSCLITFRVNVEQLHIENGDLFDIDKVRAEML